jgi:lysophospholipase L1-like esterase
VPGPTEVGQSRRITLRGLLGALVVIALVAAVAGTFGVRRQSSDTEISGARTAAPTTEQATLAMVPKPGTTGTATCTDPVGHRQWRVTWKATTAIEPTPSPTATQRSGKSGKNSNKEKKKEERAAARASAAARSALERAADSFPPPATPTGSPFLGQQPNPDPTTPVASAPPTETAPAGGYGSTSAGSTTGPGSTSTSTAGPSASSSASPSASASAGLDPAIDVELGNRLAARAEYVALVPTGFAVRSLPVPGATTASGSAGRPTTTPATTTPATSAPTGSTPSSSTSSTYGYPGTASPTSTYPGTTGLGGAAFDGPQGTALGRTGLGGTGSSPTSTYPGSTSGFGTPTGLATGAPDDGSTAGSAQADGWESKDYDTWLLRWSPTVAETATASKKEDWKRLGSLSTLAAIPMTVRQDPRYVTPDGACSVYLAPFVSGTAGERNSVAVIGDSLVAQLYASEDGTATGTGFMLNRLVAAGDRAEIAGQGGRRWTIRPSEESTLIAADASMLDEIRGLREARSVVIALGTNDAGWVALASNREQYELRLAWVLLHLAPILDELRDHGHCTVLTTMATRNKNYVNTQPGVFDGVATRINSYLRERTEAASDPKDRLRLWDWAGEADRHGTTDPDPWFGPDTIHLTPEGRAAYADELAAAADQC